MREQNVNVTRRTETLDLSKLFESALKLARSGEREKALSMLVHGLGNQDKEIIQDILRIYDEAAKEVIPFVERKTERYKRYISRSLFSRDSDLKREVKTEELAMEGAKKVLRVLDEFISGKVSQVIKAREQLASAHAEIMLKLIESAKVEVPMPPAGNENLEARMGRLEEKLDRLLNR